MFLILSTVSGTITLAGAFNLTTDSYTPTAGETYTIIDNTGDLPISGIFAGLPEGTVFTVGTDTYVVTYLGLAGYGQHGADLHRQAGHYHSNPQHFDPAPVGHDPDELHGVALAASTEAVTVNYATFPGTAIAGVDYDSTSGTLTFPAGTTGRPFR